MTKKIISTELAPQAIGPYSQAVQIDKLLYISGQLPLDPKTMLFGGTTIIEQTKQVLENLKAIITSIGYNLKNIIKINIFLKNMSDFSVVNEVYQTYFKENFPARSVVAVVALPKDALIEIEAVAYLD